MKWERERSKTKRETERAHGNGKEEDKQNCQKLAIGERVGLE